MENSLNQVAIPTFHKRKERKAALEKSEVGNTKRGSLVSIKRSKRSPESSCQKRSRRRRTEILKVEEKDPQNQQHQMVVKNGCHEEEEKTEVERKIVALQRIVPGGESLGVDKLFEETADYIMALQCRIKAMRCLASFLEGLEKEKRKFGG